MAEVTITLTAQEPQPEDFPQDGTEYSTGRFVRWYRCSLCGYTAPVDRMGFIGRVPYCYKYGCYEERS